MNLRDVLRKKRSYLDSNIVIYLLDKDGTFSEDPASKPLVPLVNDIKYLMDRREMRFFTSDKVYEEIVKNYYEKGSDRIGEKKAKKFLKRFENIVTNDEIDIEAGKYLEIEPQMSLPDAIHVVSAVKGKCDIFLTNDERIVVPKEMTFVLLLDYIEKFSKDSDLTHNYKPKF